MQRDGLTTYTLGSEMVTQRPLFGYSFVQILQARIPKRETGKRVDEKVGYFQYL